MRLKTSEEKIRFATSTKNLGITNNQTFNDTSHTQGDASPVGTAEVFSEEGDLNEKRLCNDGSPSKKINNG